MKLARVFLVIFLTLSMLACTSPEAKAERFARHMLIDYVWNEDITDWVKTELLEQAQGKRGSVVEPGDEVFTFNLFYFVVNTKDKQGDMTKRHYLVVVREDDQGLMQGNRGWIRELEGAPTENDFFWAKFNSQWPKEESD